MVVRCKGATDASPQDIIDHDLKEWNQLWQKLGHVADTPWREGGLQDGVGDSLPTLGHVELRAAARTFKSSTAIGVDALSPSHFAWLSCILLDCIALLLM